MNTLYKSSNDVGDLAAQARRLHDQMPKPKRPQPVIRKLEAQISRFRKLTRADMEAEIHGLLRELAVKERILRKAKKRRSRT